jgi:FkbM family methyltransferase
MKTYNIDNLGEITYFTDIDKDTFKFRYDKLSELIPEGSVVLDIGAHVGMFSLLFGSCVGDTGKVISFEPNPTVFNVLKQHIENNQFNIEAHNLACTLENKKYIFNYSDPNIYNTGMNGGYFDPLTHGDRIKQFHSYELEVNGVNILDFLNKNYPDLIDKINFIKIDTEGFDKEVLKTLAPIIKRNNPILMVEAFKALTSDEIKDFYSVLKSFDYEIYDVSPLDNQTDCTGPISNESEFQHYIYKVVDNGNFFCFHKDQTKKYNLPTTIPGKTAVITFGRNDGYKEKERFATHLSTMLETFDEVIYVDWNSDNGSFLYEVLDIIPKTGRLKHFVISPEYAKLLTMNDPNVQVCNTVLSFNIAIRRTDAEWIVLSTTDIIPPKKKILNDFISKANKTSLYTFSRRDIEYDDVISNLNNLDEFRQHLDNTTSPRYFPTKVTPNDNYSIFNCCGDFQLASKNLWLKIRGYEEMMLYACFVDTNAQKKAVLYGFDLIPVYDIPLYHMSHKGMENDGSSPSKQYYNDAWGWVETFDKYQEHDHIMFSRNADTWGFSNVDIEYEIF